MTCGCPSDQLWCVATKSDYRKTQGTEMCVNPLCRCSLEKIHKVARYILCGWPSMRELNFKCAKVDSKIIRANECGAKFIPG